MSMIANILRISAQELTLYLGNSNSLTERIKNNALIPDPYLENIDQSWDGIVYLLTGKNSSDQTHPLSKIIFSHQFIDKKQNLGYGPAHYLLPEQVKEINAEISTIIPAQLKQKFDATQMKMCGVYPNAWDEAETADYLIEYFESIQQIYQKASQNNEALVVFIT